MSFPNLEKFWSASDFGTGESSVQGQISCPPTGSNESASCVLFGLQAGSLEPQSRCDRNACSEAHIDADSQVASRLLACLIKVCPSVMYGDSHHAEEEGIVNTEHYKITVRRQRDIKQPEGAGNHSDCVSFAIAPREGGPPSHAPLVFFMWVYNRARDTFVRVTRVETTYDYAPYLQLFPGAKPHVATVLSLCTAGVRTTLDYLEYTAVPFNANLLHDSPLSDLSSVSVQNSQKQYTFNLDKALGKRNVPGFLYATRTQDHNEAVQAVLENDTELLYTRYWHAHHAGAGMAQNRLMLTSPARTHLQTNVVYLGANGGKSLTGSCLLVHVRTTGVARAHVAAFQKGSLATLLNIGVQNEAKIATTASSKLLASSYMVDDMGSLCTLATDLTPVVVHTAWTDAIRNAMMGHERTTVYASNTIMAAATLVELSARIMGLETEVINKDQLHCIRWRHSVMNANGYLLFKRRTDAVNCLTGVLSARQASTIPGSRASAGSDSAYTEDFNADDAYKQYGPTMSVDTGLSLLGRFMHQASIKLDKMDLRKVILPEGLYERKLFGDSAIVDVGPRCEGTNVLVDIEYALQGGEATPAIIGMVVCQNGKRVHAALSRMREADAEQLTSRMHKNPKLKAAWDEQEASDGAQEELSMQLVALRMQHMIKEPARYRLWGKGIDNDCVLLLNAVPSKPTFPVVKRSVDEHAKLRRRYADIGAIAPKFDDLAPQYRLPPTHNPVVECAVFAHHIGLCEDTDWTDITNGSLPPVGKLISALAIGGINLQMYLDGVQDEYPETLEGTEPLQE